MLIPKAPADIERECLNKIRSICNDIVKDIDEGNTQDTLNLRQTFLNQQIKRLAMLKEMGCVKVGKA